MDTFINPHVNGLTVHCMVFKLPSGKKSDLRKGVTLGDGCECVRQTNSVSGNRVSPIHCLLINRRRGKFLFPKITWDKQ